MYQVLLFDLDGTLTASGEGITKSVKYALEKMGRETKSLEELEAFVGPPLIVSFQKECGMTEEEAEQGIIYYRERYNTIRIFENRPYDGIAKLLAKLNEKGYRLAVASSKPQQMVEIVLKHFGLEKYFEVIVGSDLAHAHMTKAEVMEKAMKEADVFEKKETVVMIGDRKYDVEGAKETGVDCIGITYGYGDYEELKEAGATYIFDTVQALGDYFEV